MTVDLIKSLLTESLTPERLEIADNSQAHAGHAGTQSGGGHYHVLIVSDAFTSKSLVFIFFAIEIPSFKSFIFFLLSELMQLLILSERI